MKAAVVERFNRTLKEKMWRYFSHTQNYRYIEVLPDLVYSYNNTYHRTIKTSPSQVTKENEDKIWEIMYGHRRDMPLETSVKFKLPLEPNRGEQFGYKIGHCFSWMSVH